MFYPESKEHLQSIIHTARENGTALVPVSSGAPHIHGASENAGAETVCFEKMSRILKIDRYSRYVRVEAGVTFGELIPAAAARGLRLNHPFLPRANKSVVASALEREAVMAAKYQYDYTDPLLNVEIVFGTGDDFRTGSASGPGPAEELKADMVTPWGPGAIDFLRFFTGAQGTMGFVTWATLKAELLPCLDRLRFVEADEAGKLTSLANTLLRRRIPDDCVILNDVNFAAAFSDDEAEADILRRHLPPWVMVCRVCGYERYPERRVSIYQGYLEDACREAGLRAVPAPFGLDGIEERVEKLLFDCDSRETWWKMRRGGLREILFLTPPVAAPSLLRILQHERGPRPGSAPGITLQPQVQGRAFRVECDVFYDAASHVEARQADEFRDAAEKELFAKGAYFDRPYGRKLSDMVYAADRTGTESLRKLKKIFDPDGILNPGKLCF